jgi:hypothetical protein
MQLVKTIFLWILLPFSLFADCGLLDLIEYAPPKEWVASVGFSDAPDEGRHQGVIYLLADQQYHQLEKEVYFHRVKKILTSAALDSVAKVELCFAPSYEKVTLHQMQIYRDGEVIDQLSACQKKVLDEGFSSHHLIYEEQKRLVCILEDLREGDVLEYSYTIKRDPPFFMGHAQASFPLVKRLFAKRVFNRLVGRPELQAKVHGIDLTATEERVDQELCAWTWVREQVEPILVESNIPAWYFDEPWIQVSDWESWEAIGKGYASALSFPEEAVSAVAPLVRQWQEEHEDVEGVLLAALDFVQNQIRYLSMHEGEESWRPHCPNEVLARRYGDCKDKTALFLAILEHLQIEGYPVLVNSTLHQAIEGFIPCSCFDHVIAALVFNGEVFFIDPTRSLQVGGLKQRALSPYRVGLPLKEGCAGLVAIPSSCWDTLMKQSLKVHVHPHEHTAEISLHKVVSGYMAEELRHLIQLNSTYEIRCFFENYLHRFYENIEYLGEIQFADDIEHNCIEAFVDYKIADFGEADEDSFSFELQPLILQGVLRPINTHRKSPLGQYFPYAVEEELILHVDGGEISEKEKNLALVNPSFEVLFSKECIEKGFVIRYAFHTLKDVIEPADFSLVKKHFKLLGEQLNFSFEVICN